MRGLTQQGCRVTQKKLGVAQRTCMQRKWEIKGRMGATEGGRRQGKQRDKVDRVVCGKLGGSAPGIKKQVQEQDRRTRTSGRRK